MRSHGLCWHDNQAGASIAVLPVPELSMTASRPDVIVSMVLASTKKIFQNL
jgi:hypothetical protein